MKQTSKNIFFAIVLGALFLSNAINFHFYTHLFECDESASTNCEHCTHIVKQENLRGFILPTHNFEIQLVKVYNVDERFIYNYNCVKKTILTDYFFNKPPPTSYSI